MASAYLSLLEAEEAGGDITILIELLNTALNYYSEAVRSFENGDYENVIIFTEKVEKISNTVLKTDVEIKIVAEHYGKISFRNQLFQSSIVITLTILCSALGWTWFKKYSLRRAQVVGL